MSEPDEISSGIITFRVTREELIEVLLLDHGSHISHPKGHIEEGETPGQTALRELKEETDLELVVISPDPIYTGEYPIEKNGRTLTKKVSYFAGVIHRNEVVRISPEHIAFYWKDVRGARRMITHEGDKLALDSAATWLLQNDSTPIFTAGRLSQLG
ncbi:MAG: NUDIX domain-containing protein [Candidatus Heimdallarchaeota archaeon]|nr:NUDIX domain-containing protein [Candidatus Heimdallarchaeota archaeon]